MDSRWPNYQPTYPDSVLQPSGEPSTWFPLEKLVEQKPHILTVISSKHLLTQYNNSVMPMYIKYVEPTSKYADIIIKDNNYLNDSRLII